MEESFKDLQEIYARGLMPRAGDSLRQSFDELMHWIVRVQQQNEGIADNMSRVSAETGMLYQDAANTFEKLFAIGREINLDNPYNPDELSHFRDLLRNAMDNDLPEIYARIQYKDGLTDNVKNNLMRLDDMCQDFYKLVEQEIQKNQEQTRYTNSMDEKGFDDLQLTQNNEREMTAQDIVQSQADDKRKLEEERQQQDKVADKQGIKKENPQQKKEQITPEQALENIENLARRYQGLYAKAGSIMNNSKGLGHAKDELLSSIKYVVDNKLVSPEVAKSLQESFKYMMENALHSQRHMQGLQRIGQIVSKERKNYTDEQGVKKEKGTPTDLQLTQNNEREMHAQDIVQNPENDKRKLEEEQQQQDKEKDKNGLKKENPERRTGFSKSVKFTNQYTDKVDKKTPDEKIAELQRIDEMFDRAHSAESFKKMMFGIRDGVRAGLISRDQAKAYQAIFDEVKEHKNWENGIFLLSTELNVQQNEIRDAEKAQASSYDKSNKFKDGINRVLEMQHREKSKPEKSKNDKEKQDLFVQMLRRKKLKGVVE